MNEPSARTKLSLSTALIISTIILAITLGVVSVRELSATQKQWAIENAREKLTSKQNECESLSSGVKTQWKNVMGVTYSELLGKCEATYLNLGTGKVSVSPLDEMENK